MIERYSRRRMRELWNDRFRYEMWFKIELAVCQAMEDEGLVPLGTTEQIKQKVIIDPERIIAIEKNVHHDIIAFLSHLEEQVGEEVRWLHFGMTSSDILDTTFALQLQRAGLIIQTSIEQLLNVLRRRAEELKNLPIIGRTHGIHAEPTTVGLIFAGYYAEMYRNKNRLNQALKEISIGKISGAVGIYGNLTPQIEYTVLKTLGLCPETCATQVVARDRHAVFFSVMALIAAAVERIALQIRHWQRTEVGEAHESFGIGQKGSSAMPHKRNPILSENLCGLSRLVRSYADASFENIPLWHERDISHSSVERVIGPDITILVDFMLQRVIRLMDNLVIDQQRIERNLEYTRGLVFSESVMLALVNKGLARQRAYELVQKQAFITLEQNKDFIEVLSSNNEINSLLSSQELKACFDFSRHLRYVDYIFNRTFKC